jgi:hypothetical protein
MFYAQCTLSASLPLHENIKESDVISTFSNTLN